MAVKANSLAHTKWYCKYHIVFTPKYRRKVIYNQYRESLIEIFQLLCKYKGVAIIEGHMMPDHVHLLVSIPPKLSVASFMRYLNNQNNASTINVASQGEEDDSIGNNDLNESNKKMMVEDIREKAFDKFKEIRENGLVELGKH